MVLPIIDKFIGNSTFYVHAHTPNNDDSSVIQSSRSPIFVRVGPQGQGKQGTYLVRVSRPTGTNPDQNLVWVQKAKEKEAHIG